MLEPRADRPHMPGYGIVGPDEGQGLLPWSWAVERLTKSHDYWVATARPDGRPHVMPVWGVWLDDAVWFSSGRQSRKARNLEADPRCVMTTDDAVRPVVVEGRAERVTDRDRIAAFIDAAIPKYGPSYSLEFLDPDVNGTYRVEPAWAFGMDDEHFESTPTRWRFD